MGEQESCTWYETAIWRIFTIYCNYYFNHNTLYTVLDCICEKLELQLWNEVRNSRNRVKLDECTFIFSLSSYEREVGKWKKFLKFYSFKMTWTASFHDVFMYFTRFVVSTYIFIWVCWILMAYESSTTSLFTKLQKTFSSCEPKQEWPHASLYNYNGRQIELLHMKWFNCG